MKTPVFFTDDEIIEFLYRDLIGRLHMKLKTLELEISELDVYGESRTRYLIAVEERSDLIVAIIQMTLAAYLLGFEIE